MGVWLLIHSGIRMGVMNNVKLDSIRAFGTQHNAIESRYNTSQSNTVKLTSELLGVIAIFHRTDSVITTLYPQLCNVNAVLHNESWNDDSLTFERIADH